MRFALHLIDILLARQQRAHMRAIQAAVGGGCDQKPPTG